MKLSLVSSPMPRRGATVSMLSALSTLLTSLSAAGAEPLPGEKIYQEKCASCHGARGEGTLAEYPQPLVGDRSVKELADLITRTMPKGSPEDCVGEEAQLVAAYIHDAFYSRMAQVRNQPPRIELARLTVRQYRESLADLVGSFRPAPAPASAEGLRGEYFKSRRFRNEDRAIDRLDPVVDFTLGEGSPAEGTIDPKEYGARWQGSVFAPETGEYEFIVRTENGARLWVNQPNRPLIDVWVKSGSETEFREAIWLLGGRRYPIRLEFLKSREKTGSIALAWKLPQRAEELIPGRCLSPTNVPEVFVNATPFPPDDRSTGFERGTSVSKAWDQATTDGAIATASYVVANLRELSGVRDDAPDRVAGLKAFCRRFVERAVRRPLTDSEFEAYVEHQFADAEDPNTAVKRVVLLVLKSTRFLFPELAPNDGHLVASRLALGLWDSLPDPLLWDAAASGKLSQRDEVAHQAERMLSDPRARAKLREFLLQWLKVDQIPNLSKDPQKFPDFTPAVASDLRTSLDLFLHEVLTSESADFRQLLTADGVYLNGRLAALYGVDWPADGPFARIPLEASQRAGVLTHPYLLADFAYTATSSPIHRGVFISRSVLGRFLRPPPEAVAPLPVDLHAGLTTRQRVMLQTKSESCQACHGLINPLGFTLEHFDAMGRYRQEENGQPVDATGTYVTRTGDVQKFSGVRELAEYLATGDEAHRAIVEQMFQYLVKQPIQAFGPQLWTELDRQFVAQQFNLRRLAVNIVVATSLRSPDPARSNGREHP